MWRGGNKHRPTPFKPVCIWCTALPPLPAADALPSPHLHSALTNSTSCLPPVLPCSVVLGMLPKLDLTGLPGDPPGMRYPVACLVSCCY